jgi:hypothetical protein
MILTMPRSHLDNIYAMYGCMNGYRLRMNRFYLFYDENRK